MVSAYIGFDRHPFGEKVMHSIDANRKLEIVNAFLSDPNMKEIKGEPAELVRRLLKMSERIKAAMTVRNVVAHGLYNKVGGRLALHSQAAGALLKTRTRENEIYVDTLDGRSDDAESLIRDMIAISAHMIMLRAQTYPNTDDFLHALRTGSKFKEPET